MNQEQNTSSACNRIIKGALWALFIMVGIPCILMLCLGLIWSGLIIHLAAH